jgi:hypothetical protein
MREEICHRACSLDRMSDILGLDSHSFRGLPACPSTPLQPKYDTTLIANSYHHTPPTDVVRHAWDRALLIQLRDASTFQNVVTRALSLAKMTLLPEYFSDIINAAVYPPTVSIALRPRQFIAYAQNFMIVSAWGTRRIVAAVPWYAIAISTLLALMGVAVWAPDIDYCANLLCELSYQAVHFASIDGLFYRCC